GQALHRRGAVEALDAGDHVRDAGRAAADLDRRADEPTRALDAPALHVAVREELTAARLGLHGARGEADLDRQTRIVALRRYLEEHVVTIAAELAKLEIGRAKHVRAGERGDGQARERHEEATPERTHDHAAPGAARERRHR